MTVRRFLAAGFLSFLAACGGDDAAEILAGAGGATCCSGVCDPRTNTCTSVVGKCLVEGTPCTAPTDCCSLTCGANGFCAAAQCISDGKSCGADAAGGASCCGGKCGGATCTPLN